MQPRVLKQLSLCAFAFDSLHTTYGSAAWLCARNSSMYVSVFGLFEPLNVACYSVTRMPSSNGGEDSPHKQGKQFTQEGQMD